MSRLIEECRRENDQVAMLETDEEDEDNYSQNEDYSNAIVLYSDKNTKLSQAQDLLDKLEAQSEAIQRGEFEAVGYNLRDSDDEGEEQVEESETDIVKQKEIEDEQNDLRRRLQEQEDNLATIMKELEEKEEKLKLAIEENNKYLDDEAEMESEEGQISTRVAAHKFSSARGKAFKLPKTTNTEIPADKVIEELPEESDDEEQHALDDMIENAKNFNMEFESIQSNKEFYSYIDATQKMAFDIADENAKNIDLDSNSLPANQAEMEQSNFEMSEMNQYEEAKFGGNPNE